MRPFSRREFLGVAAAATAGSGAMLTACLDTAGPRIWTHDDCLITARPTPPTRTPTLGYQALGISTVRDGMLWVPSTYQASTPAPLVVLLHGNASTAQFWEDFQVGEITNDLGLVVVAPDSRYSSWDIVEPTIRGYGPDAKFINLALLYTFQYINVDPTRIYIGGFVDGGFEAIGLGLANGDLFSKVLAFSPSQLFAPWIQGKPEIYVTQGDDDGPVLDFTQLQIVNRLIAAGYDTTFVTFDGAQELPQPVARAAFEWMLS